MKKLMLFSVFCVVFFMGIFLAQPALAQPGPPGDVNDDGIVSISDVVYLIDYLSKNGPPPPYPIDADVDGSAGINLGDVLQLIGYLYHGGILMPYTGLGPNIGNIEFTLPLIVPGPGAVPFDVYLRLTDNPGPDLYGIVITFSYQHLPDHVGVDLNSVDFTGGIVPAGWTPEEAVIDDVNKRALLFCYGSEPLVAGDTGLIATLNFTRTENPNGDPTCLSPVLYPPTNTPLLISDLSADGTPPVDRVLTPKIGKKGDANTDGTISVSDVISLINYLFRGLPCPCSW
jgi:hypothetical protein